MFGLVQHTSAKAKVGKPPIKEFTLAFPTALPKTTFLCAGWKYATEYGWKTNCLKWMIGFLWAVTPNCVKHV